jgi:hypothetical protein
MNSTPSIASRTDRPATTRHLSNRHWVLFVDWCSAVGRTALPTTPDTVLAFLAELPAGAATVRRRMRAIYVAHQASGLPAPSAAVDFDNLLRPARFDPVVVGRVLDAIPVGGWPTGIVGRRDAALVALVCSAGLTRRHIQTLHSIPDADGQLVVPTLPALPSTPRPGTCPACAVTRWLRVHALFVTGGWRTVRATLADLGEIPAATDTTHDCTQPITPPPAAAGERAAAALFTPIDHRGMPETWAISTRSITTIIATRLTAPAYENWWDDRVAPTSGRAWDDTDRARVLAERKAANDRFAAIETSLDEADAYAETILQHLNTTLNTNPG